MMLSMHWHVRIQEDEWRFADYWMLWDEAAKTLTYKAEGYDNPKDAWGFDASYPPKKLDDYIIEDILQKFGLDAKQKILELTGYKKAHQ